MKYRISRRGFTLVELMIVIAIIGILAAALFPAMTGYLQRARDSGRIADLNNVKAVLQTYNAENGGEYPPPTSAGLCLSDGNGINGNTVFMNMFQKKRTPVDPQGARPTLPCPTPGSYGYTPIENTGSYLLWARMENPATGNYSGTLANTVTIASIVFSESGANYLVTP